MKTIIQDWVDSAIEQGYSADSYSREVLNEIGAAMENASTMWVWFEAGDLESKQGREAAEFFKHSSEEPSEESIVAAYAEGVACDH